MTRRCLLLFGLGMGFIPGCGTDPDLVTNTEKTVIQTADGLNAAEDDDKGRKYLTWQGAWLADGKGGKMRVVRVVSSAADGQKTDVLHKLADHDIKASAVNTAGDDWKNASIKWGLPAPDEGK